MKKMIIVLLLLVMATGCFGGSKNTLRCSLETSEYGVETKATYAVHFSGEKAKQADLEFSFKFLEMSEAEVAENYQFFTGMYDELASRDGITVSTKLDGNVITGSMKVDLDKIEDPDLANEAVDFDASMTIDEIRETLTNEGFECN